MELWMREGKKWKSNTTSKYSKLGLTWHKYEERNETEIVNWNLLDKSNLKKSAKYEDFAMFAFAKSDSYEDAVNSDELNYWIDLLNEENVEEEFVNPDDMIRTIDSRWVYIIESFKSRLLIKGLSSEGTCSPVVSSTTANRHCYGTIWPACCFLEIPKHRTYRL